MFDPNIHTYVIFQYAYKGQAFETSITVDTQGQAAVGRKITVSEGEVLVKFITHGEKSMENGRQSKPFCCSCYMNRHPVDDGDFTTARNDLRLKSLALELNGKGYMLSSDSKIILH